MSHSTQTVLDHPRHLRGATSRLTASLVLALSAALATACSDAAGRVRSAAPHELVVTASDFQFRAAKTVPAGLTRIRLKNEGPEMHHVELVRLEQGHTVGELLERLRARDFSPPWVTLVGGPEAPMPGHESEVTLDLAPGRYAMICVISAADHIPHFEKGMAFLLTVTPDSAPSAEPPVADTRLLLTEYAFTILPALTAGHHTIRVENAGAQPHHVAIVRLDPGVTLEVMEQWLKRPTGKPPAEVVGGATAIGPGMVNYVTVDLTAADYGLVCFVPDAHDGRPHAAHGMFQLIRVR